MAASLRAARRAASTAARAAPSGGLGGLEGLRAAGDLSRLADEAERGAADAFARRRGGGAVPLASFADALEEAGERTAPLRAAALLCAHSHADAAWREAGAAAAARLARVAVEHGLRVADATDEALAALDEPRRRLLRERLGGTASAARTAEAARLEAEFEERLRGARPELTFDAADADEVAALQRLPPQLAPHVEMTAPGTLAFGGDAAEAALRLLPHAGLRERLWRARAAAPEGNLETLAALLRERHRAAAALGHPSYASLALEGQAAGTPRRAAAFLGDLLGRVEPLAARELETLAAVRDRTRGAAPAGGPVRPWDVPFLAGRLKAAAAGGVRAADVAPYTSVDACVRGLGEVCAAAFGLGLAARDAPGEVWAPGVRRLELREGGETLGVVYLDLLARPGKMRGAATFPLESARVLAAGGRALPRVAVSASFAAAEGGSLSLAQVRTLFHEFGHALHGCLSRARHGALSGLRGCPPDVSEVPALLSEYFARDASVLARFAVRGDGEAMPEALVRGASASQRALGALPARWSAVRALADLELHGEGAAEATPAWILDTARRAAAGSAPGAPVLDGDEWPARFDHFCDGGGARHYAYLHGRAAAAQAWRDLFEGDALGARGAAGGERLRREFLEPGAERGPDALLRGLLGGDGAVDPAALVAELEAGEVRVASK